MFLSMVVDPKHSRALSGSMFEQRFNVAASRARDRMYLVRSVQMTDLSPVDLRLGLLEHFGKPLDGSIDESKSLLDACESGFEKQVYTELFNRGYRVVPQVKAHTRKNVVMATQIGTLVKIIHERPHLKKL